MEWMNNLSSLGLYLGLSFYWRDAATGAFPERITWKNSWIEMFFFMTLDELLYMNFPSPKYDGSKYGAIGFISLSILTVTSSMLYAS